VFHEITFGTTCTKHATYKKQATEFFEEASALNTDAAVLQPQETNSSRICPIGWCPCTSPGLNSKFPNFDYFWKSTASNIFQTSQHFRNVICLSAMKKLRKTVEVT
jgi:hypothetical protein